LIKHVGEEEEEAAEQFAEEKQSMGMRPEAARRERYYIEVRHACVCDGARLLERKGRGWDGATRGDGRSIAAPSGAC
jgi:hypothetical protein